jgi:hypothetical protein
MKKLIAILFLAVISQITYADEISESSVSRVGDKDKSNRPHKAPKIVPRISYSQGVLSISNLYTLYDAEIIIRDSQGIVLYDVVDTISVGYTILLSEYVYSKMQSIELRYLDQCYMISKEDFVF